MSFLQIIILWVPWGHYWGSGSGKGLQYSCFVLYWQVPFQLLVRIHCQLELQWHIHCPPEERLRQAKPFPVSLPPFPTSPECQCSFADRTPYFAPHFPKSLLPPFCSHHTVSLVKLSTLLCLKFKVSFQNVTDITSADVLRSIYILIGGELN